MLKKIAYGISALAVVGTVFAVSANKQQAPLTSEMKAYVVKHDARGHEVLTTSANAEPGQTIEYQLVYANYGNSPLKSMAVTGPIPANTSYVPNSSSTRVRSNLTVSIDGARTFEREPVRRQQRMPDGRMAMVTIPPSKYTHVRWNAADPLHAGSKQTFNYRVKVK